MTEPQRVVVIGELSGAGPPGIERMEGRAEFIQVLDATSLHAALPGTEVVLMWDFRSSLLRNAMDRADSLRWVHVAGAGVDAAMSPELQARDIQLTNARGVFDRSIAETVAGWALVFAKDMLRSWQLQQAATWQHRETEIAAGSTALVVGMGGIGREIARTLRSLRIDVVGMATSERSDDEFGVIRAIDDFDEVLPLVDLVVLVVPLTDRTQGLIGATQLASMRPTARLINVGRGGLVDEAALVDALRSGTIAGAALDVFAEEPLPADSPLWAMDNVIVSPHMSADFHGWLDALASQFMDNLDRWLDGEPLTHVVDKRLGYVSAGEVS